MSKEKRPCISCKWSKYVKVMYFNLDLLHSWYPEAGSLNQCLFYSYLKWDPFYGYNIIGADCSGRNTNGDCPNWEDYQSLMDCKRKELIQYYSSFPWWRFKQRKKLENMDRIYDEAERIIINQILNEAKEIWHKRLESHEQDKDDKEKLGESEKESNEEGNDDEKH